MGIHKCVTATCKSSFFVDCPVCDFLYFYSSHHLLEPFWVQTTNLEKIQQSQWKGWEDFKHTFFENEVNARHLLYQTFQKWCFLSISFVISFNSQRRLLLNSWICKHKLHPSGLMARILGVHSSGPCSISAVGVPF